MKIASLLTPLAPACLVVLLLTGCVTETVTSSGPVLPGQADSKEASRINTQLGIDYMRQGMNDLALEKLQRAIEQDSGNADAHSALALLYTRTGDNESAERYYRKALLLAPDDPGIRNSFGAWLCSHGKETESLDYFIKAAQHPSYKTPAAAYSNAGACAMRLGNLNDAETYLRKAVSIDAKFPDALAQMAILSYRQQQYLQARAFLQRYESVGRTSADMLLLGMRTEQQLGDRDAASEYARRLKQNFPEVAERIGTSPN